jgi:hypothetical protein
MTPSRRNKRQRSPAGMHQADTAHAAAAAAAEAPGADVAAAGAAAAAMQ